MKKFIFTLSFVLSSVISFSQVNFYKLGIGGGVGATLSYADVRENSQSFSGYITGDYNFTPFISAGLEIQAGEIKGGDVITNPHNRQFKNNYKAASLNTKVGLGQFIDYNKSDFLNTIKGFYIGAGLGAISNKMKYIVRYKPNTEAEFPPLGYKFPPVKIRALIC